VISVIVFEFRNAIALFVKDLLEMGKTLQISVSLVSFKSVDEPGSMFNERFQG
jgi:hypothetical protein